MRLLEVVRKSHILKRSYTAALPALFLPSQGMETDWSGKIDCSKSCPNPYMFRESCSFYYDDPAAQTIQSLFSSLVVADCDLADPCDYPAHYSPRDGEEFDFIVVGAGTAGCVVANRLAEVDGWKVLLIEAGGDPTKTSEAPALYGSLQRTEIDWQFMTEPSNSYCLGMENHQCRWPRGKVLGGSSTINYMVYLRGNPLDYDEWAAMGCEGWSYSDVLPYFKKFENMTSKQVLALPDFHKYHSTKGIVTIEDFETYEVKPLRKLFERGMDDLGIRPNPDPNGRRQTGCTPKRGFLKDGRRNNAAKAYLSPLKDRYNLKVSKYSLVIQVLIEEYTKTAYGVKFLDRNDRIITVLAKKEVILSAGAIKTPQLLMLSGVGPRKHLMDLGIKVIQDLPVGENLQDHIFSTNLLITLNYLNYSTTELPSEPAMYDFLMGWRSVYSSIGNLNLGCYFNTLNTQSNVPDIEFNFVNFNKNSNDLLTLLEDFNYREEMIHSYFKINSKSFVLLVLGNLLKPFSRGKLLLKNRNPKEYPILIAGYLSDHRDVEVYLRSYDYLIALMNTKPLRSVGATLHEVDIPGCRMYPIASSQYRECALRHSTTTVNHVCGTCRMGPLQSPRTVVDPRLRVKGIKRLRVIDISIMPTIPRGNTNGPVNMVGEKGADLVKETWLLGNQS
ncbi:hypothetical protein J6590_053046 [Homalodisca vitripennis]|nr:hypothetical protein J6590_053046 [Homalodisca vitripennis]